MKPVDDQSKPPVNLCLLAFGWSESLVQHSSTCLEECQSQPCNIRAVQKVMFDFLER